MFSGELISIELSWSQEYHYHCKRYANSIIILSESIVLRLKNLTHTGTTVSNVTINKNSISAFKGTKNITISCAITLNTTIGPDYSALNVTWTHNGSQLATMLQPTPSGMAGMLSMFTRVLTINSNTFSDSGKYCCVAAVIGSKMDSVTLNVLGY